MKLVYNGIKMSHMECMEWMILPKEDLSVIAYTLIDDYINGVHIEFIKLEFAAINFVNNDCCWMCFFFDAIYDNDLKDDCPWMGSPFTDVPIKDKYKFYVKQWNKCKKMGLI